MSRAKYYTYDGKTLTLNEWSKRTGLDTAVIRMRLHNGWSFQRAISTENLMRQYELDGVKYTLSELAAMTKDLTKGIIGYRIRRGMSVKEAMSLPRTEKWRIKSLCGISCFECPYDDCHKK